MATTTIDKGDLICWTVLDEMGNYTVWDVGVAAYDLPAGKDAWIFIDFKRLGGTDWPAAEITQRPISELNFYDNTKGLEKKIRAQQGDRVWCIRFKAMKGNK
ncbi:hypothetical protein LCGC14_2414770 [marine sediment metagenome]|uniref:Uncharacterized protein n=1 Tax=marine sediment metagenome TaxID=412755 RepID=A0A0F9EKT6_9ZZZZ